MKLRKMIALVMLFALPCFFVLSPTVPCSGWGYVFDAMGMSRAELFGWGVLTALVCGLGSFATVGAAAVGCGIAAAA